MPMLSLKPLPVSGSPSTWPAHLQENHFAKCMAGTVKDALQCAKYSGQDPHMALLCYHRTAVDTRLAFQGKRLFVMKLPMTLLPANCSHGDAMVINPEECASAHEQVHDQQSYLLALFHAGQHVSNPETSHRIWIPTSGVHHLKNLCFMWTARGSMF